jgi:tight adherence protein B
MVRIGVKVVCVAVLAAIVFAIPATAAPSKSLRIRHVDLAAFPELRVTALLPVGTSPELFENGHRGAFLRARQLGSAEALVLAVDNSESMRGAPLREAKRAGQQFLGNASRASGTGLVAFGHVALPLTGAGESKADVAATLSQLAPDVQPGTSLYDAVIASVSRLQRMSSGTRILVLLTDGRDLGSHATLTQAIAAAQHGNVLVYAIAAGRRADTQTLATMAAATGGRVFGAHDVTELSAVYAALGRELNRTWQFSYLTRARPGDSLALVVRAGGAEVTSRLRIPVGGGETAGPIPASVADRPITAAAIVALAALLLAVAGAGAIRRRRTPEIRRLLDPHMQQRKQAGQKRDAGRLDPLLVWTEKALADLPGSSRLAWMIERSGLKLRIGHVPYLALVAALSLAAFGTVLGAGGGLGLILILLGLVSPFIALKILAGRRAKAFDRQLPDVLATIASTLRAGHGLRPALRGVADDGSPPASEEFMRVLGEERLGRPLDEAIAAMCARIGSEDLEYVATAINVQSQTGGSLATLFDTLSETVRERQRHARKVRALTSMGRMSATVLISLPFGLALLMTLISPSYMAPFYNTSTGHVLIGFCLASMTIGGLLLKRIVNVRY